MKPKLYGTITDCLTLNVREFPDLESEVLGIVEVLSVVEITEDVDDVWCKICTGAGLEGYCMKEYIAVTPEESIDSDV